MNRKTIPGSNDVFITLSRRNLNTLIAMLDRGVGMPTLHRVVDTEGTVLYVKAEEDAEHYASEDRQESVRGQHGVGPEDVPRKYKNLDDERDWEFARDKES